MSDLLIIVAGLIVATAMLLMTLFLVGFGLWALTDYLHDPMRKAMRHERQRRSRRGEDW